MPGEAISMPLSELSHYTFNKQEAGRNALDLSAFSTQHAGSFNQAKSCCYPRLLPADTCMQMEHVRGGKGLGLDPQGHQGHQGHQGYQVKVKEDTNTITHTQTDARTREHADTHVHTDCLLVFALEYMAHTDVLAIPC